MTHETGERRRRQRAGSGIVWPLILIAAGLLFLLDNLGMVDVDWWELWRLWPLLLVLGGLDLLLGGRSLLGNLVVAVVGVVVLGLVVYFIAGGGSVNDLRSDRGRDMLPIEAPLDDAELATLDVQLGAGDLSIEALSDSDLLLSGELQVEGQAPDWQVARDGSTVRMTLDQTPGDEVRVDLDAGDEWRLALSPRAGYSLQVNLGAGSADLDLTGLDLRDVSLEAGAGSTEVTFPAAGDYAAHVTGAVGNVELTIPEGVAVRLHVERGLSTLDLPDRYRQQGDVYITDDWDGAEDRLELFVNVAVGLLTIRDG